MWKAENGVLFGDKHSYRDWGLYLKTRPVVSPPVPKTVYEDLPGADGSVDLTEALTGEVKFEDRDLKFDFKVIGGRERWYSLFSKIMGDVHGKRVKIIIDEDPSFYYIGRVEVSEWESSKVTSTIVIKARVKPYKMELTSSLEDWLWDPFNFENGIIRNYKDLLVDGELTIDVYGRRQSVIPVITSSNAMTVQYMGNSYNISAGSNKVYEISLKEGQNILTFKGDGTVSIDYRGGEL